MSKYLRHDLSTCEGFLRGVLPQGMFGSYAATIDYQRCWVILSSRDSYQVGSKTVELEVVISTYLSLVISEEVWPIETLPNRSAKPPVVGA